MHLLTHARTRTPPHPPTQCRADGDADVVTPEADEEESDAEEGEAAGPALANADADESALDDVADANHPDAAVDDVLAGAAARLEL